jgi:hypothetical protein
VEERTPQRELQKSLPPIQKAIRSSHGLKQQIKRHWFRCAKSLRVRETTNPLPFKFPRMAQWSCAHGHETRDTVLTAFRMHPAAENGEVAGSRDV